jgi:hypothetical protein
LKKRKKCNGKKTHIQKLLINPFTLLLWLFGLLPINEKQHINTLFFITTGKKAYKVAFAWLKGFFTCISTFVMA